MKQGFRMSVVRLAAVVLTATASFVVAGSPAQSVLRQANAFIRGFCPHGEFC